VHRVLAGVPPEPWGVDDTGQRQRTASLVDDGEGVLNRSTSGGLLDIGRFDQFGRQPTDIQGHANQGGLDTGDVWVAVPILLAPRIRGGGMRREECLLTLDPADLGPLHPNLGQPVPAPIVRVDLGLGRGLGAARKIGEGAVIDRGVGDTRVMLGPIVHCLHADQVTASRQTVGIPAGGPGVQRARLECAGSGKGPSAARIAGGRAVTVQVVPIREGD